MGNLRDYCSDFMLGEFSGHEVNSPIDGLRLLPYFLFLKAKSHTHFGRLTLDRQMVAHTGIEPVFSFRKANYSP